MPFTLSWSQPFDAQYLCHAHALLAVNSLCRSPRRARVETGGVAIDMNTAA